MARALRFTLVFTLAFTGCLSELKAQKAKPGEDITTRLLFIMDGSRSMMGRWERGSKMDVAKKMMAQFLDSLQSIDNKRFELALRVYGHQSPVPPQNCNDTKLEVPFGKGNIPQIKRAIRSISPKGTTPIAHSIALSGNDFPNDCKQCRNIIILLTDGVEACEGDPCKAALKLRQKGVILKPFVIGVGILPEDKESLKCIGTYFDATDEITFKKVLKVIVSQALNNTSAQVSLLDHLQQPTETNVPLTFYNKMSGKVNLQFLHTLNRRGVPDTIYLDPLVNYNLTVHSVPEVHLDSIDIKTGIHNNIKVPLPRGSLRVNSRSLSKHTTPLSIVREAGKNKILHVQAFNETMKYGAGKYDIEILTLPRRHESNITISSKQLTELEVEAPGVANFQSPAAGYGSILVHENDSVRWVVNLKNHTTRQSLMLQPGTYTVVFRTKSSQSSSYSKIQTFTIESGVNTMINLR